MKKALKITGIVLGIIILIMLLLPFAFKGKIKEIIISQGNEMIDAKFNFDRINVSLFRNFPHVSATLHDFYITGVDSFEGDTLVRVGRLDLAFSLLSLFGDSGYEIKRVAINHTKLNAVVLEDGKANWDIMKSTPEDSTANEETSDIKIKLNQFVINNLSLTYDDRAGKTYAKLNDLQASMSGDLSGSHSTLKLTAEADSITVRMGDVPYISRGRFYTKMDVDADLEKNLFTLKDNLFRLNAIEAKLDGWLALLEDGMDMDLKFETPQIGFKEILSLVPAIYSKEFESIKATGNVSMNGWAKGTYAGEQVPAFDVNIKVSEGTFRYPDLARSVDAINIAADISNPGGNADLTIINVSPFSFTIADNPFNLDLVVKTPVSDLAFDASVNGKIDLGMVKQVYPLDNMELNGIIKANISASGKMSSIEKELYDQISAIGKLELSDMLLKSEGNPDVMINSTSLSFSPKYLELGKTELIVGENDFTIESRLENYIGYFLSDKILRGSLSMSSKHLNINDFMDSGDASTQDTTAMSVIEVPRNLDLSINANLDQVLFDGLSLKNVVGNITVREGSADMKNLSINTLGGKVLMTGNYSTAKSVEQPDFAASFDMNNLSFVETFKSFVTIQKIAPLFESLEGNYSGKMNFITSLDSRMSPILETMSGKGSISTKDISLSKIGVIGQIADLAKVGGITDRKVKDLDIDFTIDKGKVSTNPFDIKMGDVSLNLAGSTSLDQTIDYTGKIQLPAAVASLVPLQNLNLKIGGTFTAPKVTLDVKDMANQVISGAVNSALSEAGKKIGIDLTNAQTQKDALIKSARDGGEIIMKTAREQADALVAKAGDNKLAQLAARKAADKVVVSAQLRVDGMITQATAKGDSIIEKAKLEQ